MRNPARIHRQFGSIHRSGYRDRGVESSGNRQMIYGNRQINWLVDRPNDPRNHQPIFHIRKLCRESKIGN